MTERFSKILITGSTGFVGKALIDKFVQSKISLRAIARSHDKVPGNWKEHVDLQIIKNIGSNSDWSKPLKGIDIIVHLAAHVHIFGKSPTEPFEQVNVGGSLQLAKQAIQAGVKRFIFMSTIGVFGRTQKSLSENSIENPETEYAQSKWRAEKKLRSLTTNTPMELVILRPPLIYGPGAPGNYRKLSQLVKRGIPIPLAKVNNKKNFLHIDNLLDAIELCLTQPAAAGETFVVSDSEVISTPELINHIGWETGCRPRLIPFPKWTLKAIGKVTRKEKIVEQLLGNSILDNKKIRETLGWSPRTLCKRLQL